MKKRILSLRLNWVPVKVEEGCGDVLPGLGAVVDGCEAAP